MYGWVVKRAGGGGWREEKGVVGRVKRRCRVGVTVGKEKKNGQCLSPPLTSVTD